MNAIVPVKSGRLQGVASGVPEILVRAGANAIFAAEEFFRATINNAHTKGAYGRSVARFLAWCEEKGVSTFAFGDLSHGDAPVNKVQALTEKRIGPPPQPPKASSPPTTQPIPKK
jgi:hypothetical protein